MSGAESERPLQTLTYDSCAVRLRVACRLAGMALLAAPLFPFEAVGDQPIFVWSVMSELHPAAAFAAIAPVLVGLVVLCGSLWVRRPSLLAWLTLLALGTLALVTRLGAEATAWEVGSVPDSVHRRTELVIFTIALSGAALRLLAEPAARRAAGLMSGAAVASGLIFALWPARGEAPLQTFLRTLLAFFDLPDIRLVLGFGLILIMVMWPLLAAGVAATLALTGSRRQSALIAEIVTFGFPALLVLLAARNVLLTYGDISVVLVMAFAVALTALLALTARSLELAALWATGLSQSSDHESGAARRFVAISSSVALATLVGVFALARPMKKGIEWTLGKDSAQADQLFGELLPKWALSRARWGMAAEHAASATELAESRAAGNDLLRAARVLDAGLAQAVSELVARSSDLDLAGRRWFHLIEGVNEASRRAQLPYYLDPSVSMRGSGKGARLFSAYPYRIEHVWPAQAAGNDYALLDVRKLGQARESHQRLGFSRDVQPFALVVLDEIEPYASSLSDLAARQPPTCSESAFSPPVFTRCGSILKQLAPTTDQVRRLVARHELQHQIDGPELTTAAPVLKELEGYSHAAIDEVNRELSAYVAELVAAGVSPKLALVHTLPFLYGARTSGLYFVGKLEFLALGDRRGVVGAGLSDDELDALFVELTQLSDDQLRERARSVHERLFDSPLPDVPAR